MENELSGTPRGIWGSTRWLAIAFATSRSRAIVLVLSGFMIALPTSDRMSFWLDVIDCPTSHRLQYTSPIMPHFVIEREIPGAGTLSEAQIREISLHSLQTLKQMGPQIQWLNSYVTEDKVYCVYLAPDEQTIREHARKSGIPANRISAVRRLIDPTSLE